MHLGRYRSLDDKTKKINDENSAEPNDNTAESLDNNTESTKPSENLSTAESHPQDDQSKTGAAKEPDEGAQNTEDKDDAAIDPSSEKQAAASGDNAGDSSDTENANGGDAGEALADDEDEEGSTIFQKKEPVKHAEIKKKKSRLKVIIIMLVVLAVIAGAICAVVFLTPNSETGTSSTTDTSISVLDNDTLDIERLNITNPSGELEFVAAKKQNDEGETVDSWTMTGYDMTLIADSFISSIADKAAMLDALRKMESEADYGLDDPQTIVNVTGRNGLADYQIFVGDSSPDGSGSYVSVSGQDGIYLVATSIIELFNSTPEEIANNVLISPPSEDTVSEAYLAEDGTISYVDKISLSGAFYPDEIVIEHTDNEMAAYRLSSPISRYADLEMVNSVLEIVNNGIVALQAYKLQPTDEDYEKYGLNNPDAVIRITYDGKTVNVTAKKQSEEEGAYAVIVDNKNAIYKVSTDAMTMLDLRQTDFYNQFVFLEEMSDFKNITIVSDKTYSFDITYNADDNITSEKLNGKDVDDSLFRTYYSYFTSMKPTVESSYPSGDVAMTVTFTYRDTSKGQIKMEFINHNDRRYQVRINGNSEGVIPYTYFDNLKNYVVNVEQNQGIPDVV